MSARHVQPDRSGCDTGATLPVLRRSDRYDRVARVRGDGLPLALLLAMKQSAEVVTDMMTLARLHAALDAVTQTEQMMAQIHESSALSPPTVTRVGELVAEARELLRWLLMPPQSRQAVRKASTRPDSIHG